MTATLLSFTISINLVSVTSILKPGIASSLSSVPPVYPKPLPDILATGTPTLATSGAKINVVVSPTPPVECLSTFVPATEDRSITSPE